MEKKNEELNPKNLVGTVKYVGGGVLVCGCMSASGLAGNDFQRERNESILRRSERRLIRRNILKWSYNDGKTGYSNWPKMLKSCGGSQQSPVDIDTDDALKSAFLKPIEFHGYDKPLKNAVILNNGHTVLIKTGKNSNPPFIKGGGLGGKYTFRQLHFHWGSSNNKGSEHRIDGKTYPAELHIVHEKNKGTGDLAIVAVFLEVRVLILSQMFSFMAQFQWGS
ncbi:Putative carbonic anhydrase 3 [Araneus ventricosus]|uniref:Carbonic anhydrase n=1 Tax=Araneus ventricosus TaxID=182803 RepID=A0A4Y2EGL7_ARAVE|nr:Putative carbonic anhydrase 3 [Araneus ventricosus]